MFEHTISVLGQQRWIRSNTIWTLYLARTYKAVRDNYLKRFHPGGAHNNPRNMENRRPSESDDDDDDDDDHDHTGAHWDWAGYPHLWRSLVYYQFISNGYMLYICVREFLLMPISDQLAAFLGLTKPGNCYLLGRLLMADHPTLDRMNSSLISLAQIIWRALQRLGPRPYELNMFHFLMMSDHDVEQFHRRLEATRKRHMLYKMIGLQDTLPTEPDLGARPGWLPGTPDTGRHEYQRQRQGQAPDRGGGGGAGRSGGGARMSARDRDRFFTSVLCFKISNKCTVDYKMRPHRTLQARARLRKQTAETALFCCLLYACSFIVITSYTFTLTLNDHRYLRVYPGCDPELNRAKLENKLGWWSFSSRHHKLLALLFDLVENVIVWTDSGVALIFVCASSYVLNFDILEYWQSLDARAKHVYQRLQAESNRRYEQQRDEYLQFGSNWTNSNSNSDHHHQPSARVSASSQRLDKTADGVARRRISFATLTREATQEGPENWDETTRMDYGQRWSARRAQEAGRLRAVDRELERLAHELRAEIFDFFHEIDRVDLLVSDIITTAIVTWLFLFSFVAHFAWEYYLRSGDMDLLVRVYSVELFAFSGITLMSINLIRLHKCCMRTYQTLCSLMAHDTSNKKCAYLGVLEFFTIRKRTAYSLFQTVPYTGTTYLSIFGWSITCYFLLSSLLRGHRY